MKAQVLDYRGTPTLFLDGEPAFFGCHLVGSYPPEDLGVNQDIMRVFAQAGVHIYSIDAVRTEWVGPRPGSSSHFDFSQTAGVMQDVLDVDPDALFLLRMMYETRYLPGNWWNEMYPDELELLSDGTAVSASFASTVWRAQVNDLLRAYIAHLRDAGLYDRVIAYQICTGTCGEWIKSWSSMDPECGDYSKPMQVRFEAWLRERYENDAARLQEAWADPSASFVNARAPSADEQLHTAHFLFRDPAQEQKVIDFYDCYAETSAEALLGFCQTVKTETNGEKLAGAFFGYLMEISWNNSFFVNNHRDLPASEVSTIQRSGHLGLRKALQSPDLDFLVSPYGYAFRGLGGDGLPMQPTESLRYHNKLYLFEEDTLMHNNFDPDGRMHTFDHSIAIYQRNFAQIAAHGLGVTWWESSHFREHPPIEAENHRWIQRFQALGNWSIRLDRSRCAEAAVILDDESFFYETIRNSIDIPLVGQQRVISLNRFGAPHDLYLLDDLLEGSLPAYKLYIFLNPFHLDDMRRTRLKKLLCRDGKTLLWLFAPGYINKDRPEPIHLDHMTDLTGFEFGRGESYWAPFMHLTDFYHPITHGLPQDLFWGTTRSTGPFFFIKDPEARSLGQVVGSLGRIKPGFGVKEFDRDEPEKAWNSVYIATPNVPPAVLRGIARYAGVHLYNEKGDVLYASKNLLAVHTVSGGERHFKLPQPVEAVFDLYGQALIAENTSAFHRTLAPASTALYFTGDRADLP